MSLAWPAPDFPGTPPLGRWVVRQAVANSDVLGPKWIVPLEAIARYESDWNPYATGPGIGMMQLAAGMYESYWDGAFNEPDDHVDPIVALELAIAYIMGKLTGYGGYGGIGVLDGKVGLLPRTDRGPGNVLRQWVDDPKAFTYQKGRSAYAGY